MLHRMRHEGLPDAQRTKLVKMFGCRQWQAVPEIERLLTFRWAEEYHKLVTQAVVMLLEGNRPTSTDGSTDDAAAMSRLEDFTPELGVDDLATILQDVMTHQRVLKQQLKAQKPGKRPRSPAPETPADDEPPPAPTSDHPPIPLEAPPPPPLTPAMPPAEMQRDESASSMASGSTAVDWQSDHSLSSEDSRLTVATNNSFEDDAKTATTDPSGLSLVSHLSDLSEDEGDNFREPSPACSSGTH